MNNKVRQKIFIVLVATISSFAGLQIHAIASDYSRDSDRKRILQQREAEKIRPLEEIMKMVKSQIRGELIETEFEFEDGVPIYEFKYIKKTGVVMELYVNARTGKIIREKVD